jgi:hypothetical protein
MYYRWIWPRQEPLDVRERWLEARKNWHREVRYQLQHHARPGLDSPLLLARAAHRGQWKSYHWPEWNHVRKTAQPEVEAVWIDDFLVKDAVRWGQTVPAGIIWYTHDAVGQAIASAGRFPLYAAGAVASTAILNESGTRTIVASANAHGEGKNLQMFNLNLVTTPSSNGKHQEQLLGRTHRDGQTADEVQVHFYRHTPENIAAIDAARQDARFIEQTLGTEQRLNYATFCF